MFSALTQYDEDGKTPLDLAIENNHLWYNSDDLALWVFIIYSTAFLEHFKNTVRRENHNQVLMKRKHGMDFG